MPRPCARGVDEREESCPAAAGCGEMRAGAGQRWGSRELRGIPRAIPTRVLASVSSAAEEPRVSPSPAPGSLVWGSLGPGLTPAVNTS